jgi:BT1 family
MEATVYALLAGFQNYGSNVSRSLGVGLINVLGIKTTVPCNFDNLPFAIVLCHVLMPLLTLPLIFVLIPDAVMTEKLLSDGPEEDEEDEGEDKGENGSSDDGDGKFDRFGGGGDESRRPLVPTAPMDMDFDVELDTVYSESERGMSSVPSSFRTEPSPSDTSMGNNGFTLGSADSASTSVLPPS